MRSLKHWGPQQVVQRLNSHAQPRVLCHMMVHGANKTSAGGAAMGSKSKAPSPNSQPCSQPYPVLQAAQQTGMSLNKADQEGTALSGPVWVPFESNLMQVVFLYSLGGLLSSKLEARYFIVTFYLYPNSFCLSSFLRHGCTSHLGLRIHKAAAECLKKSPKK